MRTIFYRKFQKFVHQVSDEELHLLIQQNVDAVIRDPATGKLLEHPFRAYKIRVVRFLYKGYHYRIAYTASKKNSELVFLLIDKRKDFYQKLQRML